MDEKKKLLNKLSAAQFAAWELHVYLDTHPCDTSANEMYRKYANETQMLKNEYEKKYGPLTPSSSNESDWLCDPWPWDIEGGCK